MELRAAGTGHPDPGARHTETGSPTRSRSADPSLAPASGYGLDNSRCAPPLNALGLLTPPPRRSRAARPGFAMADVSERTLQLSVLVAFASGVLVGWQANRLRRRYLDWRKKRLQDKLAATQKKLDLA
ncbi:Putative uncharacterized protein encoded by NCRNA00116 [Bos mutus]|nr:Putative uncharacterized protein encoded by NCRNA00116 [Bos mutus]